MKTISGPPGDPTVIRQLTSHLLNSYNSFMNNFDGEVTYIEGFMAAHNFHVFVVEHLVEETGDEVWRNGAVTTFERRLKNPGKWDTKVGPEE